MALRLLFFGTPVFAVPSLDALLAAGHTVAAVVTQPDRPKGRGHQVTAPPVKVRALAAGLDVLQPERIRDTEAMTRLGSFGADLAVVAAYGKILPQAVLDLPRLGFVNVHASLLPRWRGAAPIHRAVIAGDRETGITIMRVVLALDAGPMLAHASTPIDPDEASDVLEARLATIGGDLLVRTLRDLERGQVTGEAQDEAAVTYAARLERRDSEIDWARPAIAIHNQIRGLHPWPLAAASLGGRRLLLRRSVVAAGDFPAAAPGTIVSVADGLDVATGAGHVRIVEVQPEGRRPMPVAEFARGHRITPGERFGPAVPPP
jgi:methionyl-tRNA formyltransferase